jgi:predicted Fe-Mo cluster-binding NifX family protein
VVVGLALPVDRLDAPLSEHFGRAPWLAVVPDIGEPRFLRNEGQNGRAVAQALAGGGVTDVVAPQMGAGALGHLLEAGIRTWKADPMTISAADQVARLRAGGLERLEAEAGHGGHGAHGGGCGCGG